MLAGASAPCRSHDVHRSFIAASPEFPPLTGAWRYLRVVLAGLATTLLADLVLVVTELAVVRILERSYARPITSKRS